MAILKRNIFAACLLLLFFIISCKDKKNEEPATTSQFSYVVSDSLKLWCKNKMPASRILAEGDTLKLLFFEEELNRLWKPPYSEETVKELSRNGEFNWEELPAHEGNRRWALSLTLQAADSTYLTPNNLLVYLFR
jgi:hypothetical protein